MNTPSTSRARRKKRKPLRPDQNHETRSQLEPIDCRATREINRIVKERGLSVADVQRALVSSFLTVRKMLDGLLVPDLDFMIRVRNAYGIKLDWWIPDEESERP